MMGFSVGVLEILRSKSSIESQFDMFKSMLLAVGVVELLVVDNHNLNWMIVNGGSNSPEILRGSHDDQVVPSTE